MKRDLCSSPRARATRRRARLVAVAAILSTVAAPSSAREDVWDKWGSWGALHVQPGTEGAVGGADLFVAIVQDRDWLTFADVRGRADDDWNVQGSLGLGYRRFLGERWLWGLYGYFDVLDSEEDHDFYQGSLGAEILSRDFELRVNGYLPEAKERRIDSGAVAELLTTPTAQTVGIRVRRERALGGGDFELGARIPFPGGDDFDLRVFLGGYYRDARDYHVLFGPSGRLEMRWFDLPGLPTGSRFTLGAETSWDGPRGHEISGFARIRIPFGRGREPLRGLDRRMVDRPIRDGLRVRRRLGKPEPARFANGTPIGNIAYTDGTTEGDARSVPTAGEIETALAVAGPGGIIVALDQTGPIDPLNDNQPIPLQVGQVLMGGGSSVLVSAGGANTLFTAPGGRGTFQTTDEIVHIQATDDNQVLGIDVDGGVIGLLVAGDRVRVDGLRIRNVSATAGFIGATGISWNGHDGVLQNTTIGDISSTNASFQSAGVEWLGDRGRMQNVTIGNVMATNSSVASAIAFNGDGNQVSGVTAGNVSAVNGETRALWWSVEDGLLENVSVGNATSTTDYASGLYWFQLNDGTGVVRNVTIGDVTGGDFADGVQWWHGDGTLENVSVGNVVANDGSANGLFSQENIGGTVNGLTVQNVTGSAAGGAGSAAGVRLSFTDGLLVQNVDVGNVQAVTSGWGLGVIAQDGMGVRFENVTVGNVSGMGFGNYASGLRLQTMADTSTMTLTVGDVTLSGQSFEFQGGARGLDLAGSTLSVDGFTIGAVGAAGGALESWARGVFLAGTGGTSVRNGSIQGVFAVGAGATAIGIDFLQNGTIAENVSIGIVDGDPPNSIGLRFSNVSGATANDISFATLGLSATGVLLTGATATNHSGTGNALTLLPLGFVDCVDASGDSTGTNVEINGASCP